MKASPIHPRAAQGFGAAAAEYDRGRPGYPVSALDFVTTALDIGVGSVVIPLAAGTGKLRRSLPQTARVIAIESIAAMRAEHASPPTQKPSVLRRGGGLALIYNRRDETSTGSRR